MDKFSYGNYDSSSELVFDSIKGYVGPSNETETRQQLSYPLVELKDYINNNLVSVNSSGAVVRFRVTSDGAIQYTVNGTNWVDTSSSGHIIQDEHGNDYPQRTRLRLVGATITDSLSATIVEGLKGDKGDIGETGPRGNDGATGSKGEQGLRGLQGEQGETGYYYTPSLIQTMGGRTILSWSNNGGLPNPQSMDITGADGGTFTVLGIYATLAELESAVPSPQRGDAYFVGTSEDNTIYLYGGLGWQNVGSLKGPQGPRGLQGATGPTGPIGPQGPQGLDGYYYVPRVDYDSSDTHHYLRWSNNGDLQNPSEFDLTANLKGEKGDKGDPGQNGQGIISGGTIGQVLMKNSSTDYDMTWGSLEFKAIEVVMSSISSLPQTINNVDITENHVVMNSILSNPSAQADDWIITTSNESLTVSGTINGSTDLTLYLLEKK